MRSKAVIKGTLKKNPRNLIDDYGAAPLVAQAPVAGA
jgi:hypothetical protein